MSRYPFIVAELGANHCNNLDIALASVSAAAAAGADAIKLQTYQPECMVARGVPHPITAGPWAGMDLWDLYARASLQWSWHPKLFERAKESGIMAFSSPFSREAIDFLERIGCPMYKIASFEILDLELIAHAAKTGKPLVMSTGMASLEEITDAVSAARYNGCKDLTLLKCTSSYPAPAAEANLATMHNLRQHFKCDVGLSDHTRGSPVGIAAALHGAQMIEKHFILHHQLLSPDEPFSANGAELDAYVRDIHDAMDAIGIESFGPTESERYMHTLRRTLHVVYDLREGDELNRHNVRALRPGDGVAPRELHKFLGQRVTRPVEAGEPLNWEMVRST